MGIVSFSLYKANNYLDAVFFRFLSWVYLFTYKANRVVINIAHHVVVKTYGKTLANWLIDIRTMSVLNLQNYLKIHLARKLQLLKKYYLELMHFMLISVRNIYFVFNNRMSTLEAFRLALPRDKLIYVKLQVILQNEALRACVTICNRSRSRLAPLKHFKNWYC